MTEILLCFKGFEYYDIWFLGLHRDSSSMQAQFKTGQSTVQNGGTHET
jgi:hypothetical protein